MSGKNMLHIELIDDNGSLKRMYQEQYEASKKKAPYLDSGFDLFVNVVMFSRFV